MKKVLNIMAFFSLFVSFSSCLKDEPIIGPDAPGAVKHVIEFKNPAVIGSSSQSTVPIYVLSYDIKPSADLVLEVSYSGKDVAPNDIHIKIEVDPSAIEIANDEQESDMEIMPSDLYSISTLDITIPKGKKIGTTTVTFAPDKFDLFADYALPLKIVSVSGTDAPISGNFGLILLNVGAKNEWDGVYKVTGTTVDANGVYKGVYPTEGAMLTAGPNSTLYYQWQIDYPNFLVENITTGGLANTGIKPKFTINGSDVVVTNSGSGATIGSGTYDAGAKTFTIEWVQGRWNVHEKWVYIGPR